MPKFTACLRQVDSALVEVEAKDAAEATEKIQHMLIHEDCAHIEWSQAEDTTIESLYESEPS